MNRHIYKEQYALYKAKKTQLATLISQTDSVAAQLNAPKIHTALDKLLAKVHNSSFKIQITGTFKNGKSTFINALLGEEILPAYALPCTAVINEVKYGETKKATLHFKNPLPKPLPSQIAKKAAEHIKLHGEENVPPLDIAYDEIEDYVIIPIGKDPKEMLLESPYEKVELFWPLELLKNGIEIIDSPGLNEHATRTKVTVDYLSKADAILFVLSATSLCSKEEMMFIENTLNPQGFNELFFIVNRFDLIPEKEKSTIIKYADKKLHDFTTLSPDWLFFVSARNALDSKISDSESGLIESGFPDLENCLSSFLTENKGKTKLAQPARELKRLISDGLQKNIIAQERKILDCSLNELKSRSEAVKPQLKLLDEKKELLKAEIKTKIQEYESEFRRTILEGLAMLQKRIPEWVQNYNPTAKLGAVPSKDKINLLVTEILDHITQQTEIHQIQWHKNILMPLIELKSYELFELLRERITEILNGINNTRMDISGESTGFAPRTWQSVIDIDELSYISSSYASTDSISRDITKIISYNAIASLTLQVYESTNPFKLSASLVSNALSLITGAQSSALKKIKSSISTELCNSLTNHAQTGANTTTSEILGRFNEVLAGISNALTDEIAQIQAQLQALISEMEKDDYDTSKKIITLDNCTNELTSIQNALDKFIVDLDGNSVFDDYIEAAEHIVNCNDTDPIIKDKIANVLNDIKESNNKKIHMSIIGEFSTGKSTFINAFIKTNLMSSQFLQGTTVTATCIENSDDLSVKLIRNDKSEEIIKPKNLDELKLELSNINNFAQDIHSVHISLPAQTLGSNISIVDTPGVNVENLWHEDVTVRAINELCDIPIIIIDATKVLPESLTRFIHNHLSDRLSDCIFIVTKLDMIKASERSKIMKFVKAKLNQEFGISSPMLLGYSAIDVINDISKKTVKNPNLVAVSHKNEQKIIDFVCKRFTEKDSSFKIISINKLLDLIAENERAKIKSPIITAKTTKSMFTVRQSLSGEVQTSAPKSPGFGFKKAKLNN